MSQDSSRIWDDQAATFDQEADHGLRDPRVRAAWHSLLEPLLPPAPAEITDLGCGTGSLSVLLGTAGHVVRGLDFSAQMVAAARHKGAAAGVVVDFQQGDAAAPPYEVASCDVVLVRHVLWALPDPDVAVEQWIRLLRPDGRLILIEGRWHTGSGISAEDCRAIVRRHRQEATVRRLDSEDALWGGPVPDERYVLVSRY